jgi:hypothetical protein
MKSPWQLGLLALAVAGVSTYDYLFFKNYRTQNQASMRINASKPVEISSGPAPSALPEATGSAGGESLPSISRDELHRLAQQAFVPRECSKTDPESVWPRRDPFTAYKEPRQTRDIPAKSPAKGVSAPTPLPEPQCTFSGTLIEQQRRLALVDGVPLSIGDRLGVWQLVRIEPDYIILGAGEETRRIELKGGAPQAVRQKDPS